MVEKQNVTLSVPKSLLRKAKILAVEQETSLSGLMVDALTELVAQKDQYEIAKREHLAIIKEGLDLGTEETIYWTRESLHER